MLKLSSFEFASMWLARFYNGREPPNKPDCGEDRAPARHSVHGPTFVECFANDNRVGE